RLEEDVENLSAYGVDWEDLADRDLLHHHNNHNPNELENLDGLLTRQPPHLSLVEIPVFESPLTTQEQADIFQEALLAMPEYHSRDMDDRKSLWSCALALLVDILQVSVP
ncbi:hypothetical protein V5O48_019293, partial [Marasmius crinis-equi]